MEKMEKNTSKGFEVVPTEEFKNNFNCFGYEEFVSKVLRKCAGKKELELLGKIKLVDAEPSKRLYITNENEEEFTIRYYIHECNEKQWKASYTLYKTVWEDDGSGHGEEISCGYAISHYTN